MRLRPTKRDFFRAAKLTALFSPKIRPTMSSLRSGYCQGPLSRNLKGFPWDIVPQFDMLPIPADEERRYGTRGKRQVKPRGISTVESLNRHKGKEEIEPLHRDEPPSAQANWDSSRVTCLRCPRGDQARFAALCSPRCGFSPSMWSWRFPLFNERRDGGCHKGGKLVEN